MKDFGPKDIQGVKPAIILHTLRVQIGSRFGLVGFQGKASGVDLTVQASRLTTASKRGGEELSEVEFNLFRYAGAYKSRL